MSSSNHSESRASSPFDPLFDADPDQPNVEGHDTSFVPPGPTTGSDVGLATLTSTAQVQVQEVQAPVIAVALEGDQHQYLPGIAPPHYASSGETFVDPAAAPYNQLGHYSNTPGGFGAIDTFNATEQFNSHVYLAPQVPEASASSASNAPVDGPPALPNNTDVAAVVDDDEGAPIPGPPLHEFGLYHFATGLPTDELLAMLNELDSTPALIDVQNDLHISSSGKGKKKGPGDSSKSKPPKVHDQRPPSLSRAPAICPFCGVIHNKRDDVRRRHYDLDNAGRLCLVLQHHLDRIQIPDHIPEGQRDAWLLAEQRRIIEGINVENENIPAWHTGAERWIAEGRGAEYGGKLLSWTMEEQLELARLRMKNYPLRMQHALKMSEKCKDMSKGFRAAKRTKGTSKASDEMAKKTFDVKLEGKGSLRKRVGRWRASQNAAAPMSPSASSQASSPSVLPARFQPRSSHASTAPFNGSPAHSNISTTPSSFQSTERSQYGPSDGFSTNVNTRPIHPQLIAPTRPQFGNPQQGTYPQPSFHHPGMNFGNDHLHANPQFGHPGQQVPGPGFQWQGMYPHQPQPTIYHGPYPGAMHNGAPMNQFNLNNNGLHFSSTQHIHHAPFQPSQFAPMGANTSGFGNAYPQFPPGSSGSAPQAPQGPVPLITLHAGGLPTRQVPAPPHYRQYQSAYLSWINWFEVTEEEERCLYPLSGGIPYPEVMRMRRRS